MLKTILVWVGLIQSIGTLQILLQSGMRMKNIQGTITWHLKASKVKSKVKVGQAVSEGQVITKVGMTGYTFYLHLHFQVFIFTRTNFWIDFDTVSVQDFIS